MLGLKYIDFLLETIKVSSLFYVIAFPSNRGILFILILFIEGHFCIFLSPCLCWNMLLVLLQFVE